jgi:hypothetical protein
VMDVVREVRHREMFLPLVHPPSNAQVDFGEAVVVDGVEQKGHFLAMDPPHSDAPWRVSSIPASGSAPKSSTDGSATTCSTTVSPGWQGPYRRRLEYVWLAEPLHCRRLCASDWRASPSGQLLEAVVIQ